MLTIAERIANLKAQREQFVASMHACDGAIAVLEELARDQAREQAASEQEQAESAQGANIP